MVTILDENDNAPVFQSGKHVASFPGSGEEPGNEYVFLQLIVVNESTITNLRASVVIRCCILQEMLFFDLLFFLIDNYTVSVPENVAVDSEIATVVATDADSGSSGQVVYSILSGNEVS